MAGGLIACLAVLRPGRRALLSPFTAFDDCQVHTFEKIPCLRCHLVSDLVADGVNVLTLCPQVHQPVTSIRGGHRKRVRVLDETPHAIRRAHQECNGTNWP